MTTAEETIHTITEYLVSGGLFNPRMMDHDKVRDLLMKCREVIESQNSSAAGFPMQNGPNITRKTAEEIYVVYSCLFGKDQSLNRIGERGGFGWGEIPIFFREHQSQVARGLCRCKP